MEYTSSEQIIAASKKYFARKTAEMLNKGARKVVANIAELATDLDTTTSKVKAWKKTFPDAFDYILTMLEKALFEGIATFAIPRQTAEVMLKTLFGYKDEEIKDKAPPTVIINMPKNEPVILPKEGVINNDEYKV